MRRNTLVVMAPTSAGIVKLSFSGGIAMRHMAGAPRSTSSGIMLVASAGCSLMATKLQQSSTRKSSKRLNRDIAAMLTAGVSLAEGVADFEQECFTASRGPC